jgi:hypothetical protein
MREKEFIYSLIPDGSEIEMLEVARKAVKAGIRPRDAGRYLKRLVGDGRLGVVRTTERGRQSVRYFRLKLETPRTASSEHRESVASVRIPSPEPQVPEREKKPSPDERGDLLTLQDYFSPQKTDFSHHIRDYLMNMTKHESEEFAVHRARREEELWHYRDQGFKPKIKLSGGKRWLYVQKWNKREKKMDETYIGELPSISTLAAPPSKLIAALATEQAAHRVFVSGGKSPAQLERQKKMKKCREIRRELMFVSDDENSLKERVEHLINSGKYTVDEIACALEREKTAFLEWLNA